MSYPYPYHLLPFETYKEWFDADMKSLIHNVQGLQNECLWLELCIATPYLEREHALSYFLVDWILQANNIWHKILDIRLALLCNNDLSTLLWFTEPFPLLWLNHLLQLSKPYSLYPTMIYQLIPSLCILFPSIKFLLLLTSLLLTQPLLMISWC